MPPEPRIFKLSELKPGASADCFALLSARDRATTRDGKPYLVEVATARVGGGAESTWHEKFNLADKRKRTHS